MIPWWAVLVALLIWGVWTMLCVVAGVAWANLLVEKEQARATAREQLKWQVPTTGEF